MTVSRKSILIFASVVVTIVVVSVIIPQFDDTIQPSPHTEAINTPDTDKRIELANRFTETATVQVTVTRDTTDRLVYNGAHTLAPGTETDSIYNLNQSNPDGIETYTLTATALNQTETIELRTTQCQGGAIVEIADDGQLYPFYAIC